MLGHLTEFSAAEAEMVGFLVGTFSFMSWFTDCAGLGIDSSRVLLLRVKGC